MQQASTQLDWLGIPLIEESNSGLSVKFNTLLLNYPDFQGGGDFGFWEAQRLIDPRFIYEEHPHKKKLINGLEVEPHITLLYGLENESDFEPIKEILSKHAPLKFEIGRIIAFRNEDKPYDVMVVEILSKDLQDLHWKIRDQFPVTNDFPKYVPHMTLAYVQKGSCSEIEGESFWTGAQYSCSVVHFSNTKGEQTPIYLSPIVSEARTKLMKIGGKEVEVVLMAGGPGFKIYSYEGKVILSLGRKNYVFSEGDPEFKPIMAYVNLRYQPASSQKEIQEKFMSLVKSLKGDLEEALQPGVSLVDMDNLTSDVELPMHHTPEWYVDEGEWEEDENNYRLNQCSTILYAVKNKKVIAHLGLSDSNEVMSVYVDSGERDKGLAIEMYLEAVKRYGDIFSDPLAQESGGRAIWKRLKKLEPDRVELKRNRFAFYEEPFEDQEDDSLEEAKNPVLKRDVDDAWELLKTMLADEEDPESWEKQHKPLFDRAVKSAKIQSVPMQKAASSFRSYRHGRKVSEKNLKNPIIVADVGSAYPVVLDGNHRLETLYKKGEKSIDVLMLKLPWALDLEAMESQPIEEAYTPEKYLKGVKDKKERKKEIERNAKAHRAGDSRFDDASWKTDFKKSGERQETKPSRYTNKFKKVFGEDIGSDLLECFEVCLIEANLQKAIKNKAEKCGVPLSIAKQVVKRGQAAWASGHRPGATPEQWGLARLNSFCTGGETSKTADADLYKKWKSK